MDNKDLQEYKIKLGNLSVNEQKMRDLYLRKLALGEIQGPPTGYASIDKPWLAKYPEFLFKVPRKKYHKVYELLKEVWNNEEDVMIDYYGEDITSSVFFKNVMEVAKSLKKLGYGRGTSIPVSLESTPEFLYLLLAAELIGASIKNKLDDINGIIECINSTGSKYFFTYDYFSKEQLNLIYEKTNLKKIVLISPFECISDRKTITLLRKNIKDTIEEKYNFEDSNFDYTESWKHFLSYGEDYIGVVEDLSNDELPLFSAYTSGSTGYPKEVIHTSKSFLGIIQQMVLFPSHSKEKSRDTWLLPILPPTLVAVVVAMMCYPLADGKKLILDPFCKVEDLDLEMMHYEPTCCGFGPYFFSYLMASERIPKDYDMSYVKLIGFGAEAMLSKFINKMSDFLEKYNCHAPFSSGYGQTEGGSDFTVALGKEMLLSGSSGIPLIDTTISIFDKGTENELYYCEIGEICKCGPGIMLGYSDDKLNSEALKIHSDGKLWLHTGDYGYITENGLLYVLGRESIQINDEIQVFASVLENRVSMIEGVRDAIVVSGDNPQNLSYQVPYLFVVPEKNLDVNRLKIKIYDEMLKSFSREELPYETYFIDEKPISKGLKTDRSYLQKKYNLKRKK